MGSLDDKCIEYFDSSARFADVMNFIFCGGDPVINVADLEEADSVAVVSGKVPGEKRGKSKGGKKTIADKVKRWKGVSLRILVHEYQSYIDFAMPVRCMLGDALKYDKQCIALKQEHQQAKDLETDDEYLSGMKPGDRIVPVVTVVINLSEKKWYGPRSLYEMFDAKDKDFFSKFVSDYRMHILDYHDYDSFDKLRTDTRYVFEVLRNRDDNKKLRELTDGDEAYCKLNRETAEFIELLTNLKIPQEEGGWNMCKAVLMEREEGKAEGRAEGKAEGRAEGKAEVIISFLEDLGAVAEDLKASIMSERNLDTLKRWVKLAARSESIEAFMRAM